ncbi:MAG: short-chain dehydrogenase, partial [Chloroflexota bacterium]
KPTADDIAAHLAEVSATEPFSVPASIFDEVAGIWTRLGITGWEIGAEGFPEGSNQ